MSPPVEDSTSPLEPTEARRVLKALGRRLASSNTEVEFYFVGGAVMFQAFVAEPTTAQAHAMFRPAEVVRRAARAVAEAERLPAGWMQRAVPSVLTEGRESPGYVEAEGIRVFVPQPEYVLAIKCAAMHLGEDFREHDDVRYALRSLNLTTPEEALSIVTRYFTERQLARDTRERLAGLVPG